MPPSNDKANAHQQPPPVAADKDDDGWRISLLECPLLQGMVPVPLPVTVMAHARPHDGSDLRAGERKSSQSSWRKIRSFVATIRMPAKVWVCEPWVIHELGRGTTTTTTSNSTNDAASSARTIRVALGDYVARALAAAASTTTDMDEIFVDERREEGNFGEGFSPLSTALQFSIGSSGRCQQYRLEVQMLDRAAMHRPDLYQLNGSFRGGQRRRRRARKALQATSGLVPYVLERTDVWCSTATTAAHNAGKEDDVQVWIHGQVRVIVYQRVVDEGQHALLPLCDKSFEMEIKRSLRGFVERLASRHHSSSSCSTVTECAGGREHHRKADHPLLTHVATCLFQDRLRHQLSSTLNAVAFVADGSVLPRKSGNTSAPMASPPAVRFYAPHDSRMATVVRVLMGKWASYLRLPPPGSGGGDAAQSGSATASDPSVIEIRGLLVPRGITLIAGGGYHGKSTLLRTLASSVYNKIPGDGREFCAAVESALTVRAEDGRYVNNCNVSAFISHLPRVPPTTERDPLSDSMMNTSDNINTVSTSTQHFSTGEASGSTSQAANVCEAIEMGATALLVDEDVSAANFMARDGRMRSLVMDESITPLLYRVNGMYHRFGISTVVVVGGVGDWLDVPDAVVLMQNYACHDATAKARSISRQFSHGHVQYAGRGVVHRLPWDKSGASAPVSNNGNENGSNVSTAAITKHTPVPRRPTPAFCRAFGPRSSTIRLLDGSDAMSFEPGDDEDDYDDEEDESQEKGGSKKLQEDNRKNSDAEGDDEDDYVSDMSRCEQLLGKKPHLYGCGVGVLWVLDAACRHPDLGLPDLLRMLDEHWDKHGLASAVTLADDDDHDDRQSSRSMRAWRGVVETTGLAYRPRRFEVGQALTRLRGIQLEEIVVEDDGSEAAQLANEERKKKELLEMWNSRRKNKL